MSPNPALLTWPRPVAAGGAWLPSDLPGLAAWYDASDTDTLGSDQTGLMSWDDKSGNDRHVGHPSARFRTGTATIGGLNAIEPKGLSAVRPFFHSTLTLPQPYTVALVGAANSTGATIISVALAEGSCYAGSINSSDPSWLMNNGTSLSGGTSNTSAHVVTSIHNGALSSIRVDGSTVASGNAGSGNPTKIIVGGAVTTSASAMWNGALGEIVIVSGALTGSDLTSLETYLADKWGL